MENPEEALFQSMVQAGKEYHQSEQCRLNDEAVAFESQFKNLCSPEQKANRYYPVKCTECDWMGCSCDCEGGEAIADTGDYDDPICPKCYGEIEDLD